MGPTPPPPKTSHSVAVLRPRTSFGRKRPVFSARYNRMAPDKTATEWLFWQVGGLGPMAGQNHHFGLYAPSKIPYAIDRYVKETNRRYGGLDRHLENRTFIAGDD